MDFELNYGWDLWDQLSVATRNVQQMFCAWRMEASTLVDRQAFTKSFRLIETIHCGYPSALQTIESANDCIATSYHRRTIEIAVQIYYVTANRQEMDMPCIADLLDDVGNSEYKSGLTQEARSTLTALQSLGILPDVPEHYPRGYVEAPFRVLNNWLHKYPDFNRHAKAKQIYKLLRCRTQSKYGSPKSLLSAYDELVKKKKIVKPDSRKTQHTK